MAKLIYFATTSLDGYIEDASGSFDWMPPGADVHAFINDIVRPTTVHVLGRRMYEVMRVWEDLGTPDQDEQTQEFARIWQGVEKVVYSRTLNQVSTSKTRLEHDFDADALRGLKASSKGDVLMGGSELAATAFRAGLFDEIHLFVLPIVVGGGKPALPDNVRLQLELLDERRFEDGRVYMHYRSAS